jgi:hypothetical protein
VKIIATDWKYQFFPVKFQWDLYQLRTNFDFCTDIYAVVAYFWLTDSRYDSLEEERET